MAARITHPLKGAWRSRKDRIEQAIAMGYSDQRICASVPCTVAELTNIRLDMDRIHFEALGRRRK